MEHRQFPGHAYPLGANVTPDGVNFSLLARDVESVELLLFDSADSGKPAHVVKLDPRKNKTFYYWHILLPDVTHGQLYGWRVAGPFEPENGHRFDGEKLLLDPYTRAVAGRESYSRKAASLPGDNLAEAMKSVVVDCSGYDWEGDTPPRNTNTRSMIYELHVGGFTRSPDSGLARNLRGTFAGVVEKIPYLKELGINCIELLPVHQFDEQDAPPGLTNYWGYSTVAFFAPHSGYSSSREPADVVTEFRDMVKALHRAGIEVILDVVYNHTAEGDHNGPTISWRGLANAEYYHLAEDKSRYLDYTGCRNTLNANNSIVRRMIRDSLTYWVSEMHVDGFRFDLASVLSRGKAGEVLENPPILHSIESDPVLAGCRIIAEAWDAVGLYQVGTFAGERFAEWNGPFRDDVRRFLRGRNGTVRLLAERVTASPGLYFRPGGNPDRSIHFVTCHDGFTLNDLVTYERKLNLANGEKNRDGAVHNWSWNCGAEGPVDDPQIESLRLRQIKNFWVLLLVSQGTPMLLMGDEVRRTQLGNNNAYCQDNELSWFKWSQVQEERHLLRFVRELIRFTHSLAIFRDNRYWTSTEDDSRPRIRWHGVRLNKPDWSHHSHTLAWEILSPDSSEHLYVMVNAWCEPLVFDLPDTSPGTNWKSVVDTSAAAQNDFVRPEAAPTRKESSIELPPHSIVILLATPTES